MSGIEKLIEYIEELNLSQEQRFKVQSLLKEVKREKKVCNFKIERLGKDNAIMTNFLNTTIQELEAQKKLVEEQSEFLKINLQELKEAYNEVEQFSYIASHDLKSPLLTIGSFVKLLQDRMGADMDETNREFCHFISTGVEQMKQLINDLLKYSRVGNKATEIEEVDFNEILDQVKFNLTETINQNDAQIIIVNQLPTIKARRFTIVQLFQNLIGNAIKFRSEKAPCIHVFVKQLEDKVWEFRVKDNGTGMDIAQQNKAFSPFQRLNNQDRSGTGIGLAICKKAVKIHDGNIRYESALGEGTTFIFTITETLSLLASEPKFQLTG